MQQMPKLCWPDTLTPEERLEIASARIEKLIGHWTLAIAVRESNQQLRSVQIRNQIRPSYGANCYNILLYSQLRYELICLTAAWDKSKEHRDSIPTIFSLINNKDVHSKIFAQAENQYSTILANGLIDHYGLRRRKEESAGAKAQLKEIKNLVKLISNHVRIKKIIAYRDETIAHSLSKTITDIKPSKIPQTKGLWDLTQKCIQLLNGLVRNSSFDFAGSAKMHRRNADYFWGGVKIKIKK